MVAQGTDIHRIALFGGSFDPVHNGHLMIARYALKQVGLDRVVFIPAARSPLKQNNTYASDDARVEMLELALRGESRFKIDTFEVEQGGVSYSIDTVKYFREQYANAELYFMIGADQFEQLDQWYQIEELAQMVTFLVFGRPGSELESISIDAIDYMEVDAPLMDTSSSEVRSLCQRGQPLGDFVTESVGAFISERELYTDTQK
ncbi:MAG: nicotinate (nicotinamide) nucleotide adenylyltransferase [Opitutaceae bacterium]